MSDKKNVTFYRFYSGIRSFLSKLLKNPINAEIPDFMSDNGLTKNKLINDLLARDVISRHERILDKTNSDKETPTYSVKYKVFKKNFERKIHRLYSKYYENDKKSINECDCGSCMGGEGAGLFSGGDSISGDDQRGEYDVVIGNSPIRRNKHIYEPKPKANKKKSKNIQLTESQVRYLNEFFNTENAGDEMLKEEGEGATNTSISQDGPIAPFGKSKHPGFQSLGDGFWDEACSRGGKLHEMTKYDFYRILNNG